MLRFAHDNGVITDNGENLQNILEIMDFTMKNEYNMEMNKAYIQVVVPLASE